MRNKNTKQFDKYEDFDSQYLWSQILALKKWIILSCLFFLLCGSVYCFLAQKIWVSQVRIQGSSEEDQRTLFIFNRQVLNLKYGIDHMNNESILNEFISFIDRKSNSIKIRKDVKKSFLIQSFSDSPGQSDQDVLQFLTVHNDLFIKEFREQLTKSIERQLSDDRFIIDKNADSKSNTNRDQDVKSIKVALSQVKHLIHQPIQGQVFKIVDHLKASEKSSNPNIPLILILSGAFGFVMGLFGVVFYVSSTPIIHTK